MFRKALLVSIVFLPLAANAASLHVGGDYFQKGSEQTEDDVYVVASKAAFSGTVGGDAVALAREIESYGTIAADALFLGERVTLLGSLGDDARLMGGALVVSGIVSGDVIAVGRETVIEEGARIGGNLYLVGGRAEINGAVEGDVKALARETIFGGPVGGSAEVWGTVSILKTARIAGDLVYHAPREVRLPEGTVSGEVIFDKKSEEGFLLPWSGHLPVVFALMVLALGFVLLFFARSRTEEVLFDVLAEFWHRALRGAIACILVPVVAVALGGTVVGLFIGVTFLLLFLASVLLSIAGAGMLLGVAVERFFFHRSPFPLTYRPVLLGIVLFSLLLVIPYVGFAVDLVAFLAVFGALVTRAYRYITSVV